MGLLFRYIAPIMGQRLTEVAMSMGKSKDDLLRFLNYLEQKGLVPTATAASRKVAAGRVLSILSEEEQADVTQLDVDEVMARFGNLQGQGFTPESLRVYRSRLKASLDDFSGYLASPISFRPSAIRKDRAGETGNKSPTKSGSKASKKVARFSEASPALIEPVKAEPVLPIPLRADLTIRVSGLPFDLTKSEAQKIANIILAHVAD
jgi:hypothetical protein